jgi:hypothetical protein
LIDGLKTSEIDAWARILAQASSLEIQDAPRRWRRGWLGSDRHVHLADLDRHHVPQTAAQGLEESIVFRVEFDHAIFGVSIKFFTRGRFAARCHEMQ